MKLHLFRLSLTESGQSNLFSEAGHEGNRSDFLRRIFGSSFEFLGWGGVTLKYIHIATDGDAIFGSVSRWRAGIEKGDPNDPFAEGEQGNWRHATVLLNLADDQQVIGIGDVAGVGSPNTILDYIIRHWAAKTHGYPFKIDFFNVSRQESFKKAVETFPGKVTLVRFELVAPNPINGASATKKALKSLREKTNLDRLTETYQSDEGLNVQSDVIQGRAEYANSGAGDVVAKSGPEVIYDSCKRGATVDLDESYAPQREPPDGFAGLVKRLLRR